MEVLNITLKGTLAGVFGTGLGGLLIVLLGKPRKTVLSSVIALSGGIMLSVVFSDLLPEAIKMGGPFSAFIGLLMGVVFLLLLDLYLPHCHFQSGTDGDCKQARYMRASILIGLGIAMHNFPEGLAIGAGYAASEELGLSLTFIIGLQNVPEGMAMAGPMKAGFLSNLSILLWTALAGVPMGIGAFCGALAGGVSSLILSLSLGFAAGAMLYVVFDELLPEADELSKGHSATFGAILGIIIGLMVSLF
ncbi:Zinc/iron permease [Tepidanaerobacter acetatoxydans Re1]|uniref:Zinc/iron permease n=1 Tax=Tepidanaerobacter acetatoxydans (strain DSM 21804 / JCM 16047 / Re1) TaxID=1209989 RepID=F4LX23_TEPAE|nr:ZIP family metal transporter [Tepidanaerobacter acetatoxydans]AEE91001.1 zinc/iron permease [Tepidanaerobacter acetatoxydans Re1]CCP25607.1 Zinc/iron permease [Tepidanaerobacter acetatoxydans Re1]